MTAEIIAAITPTSTSSCVIVYDGDGNAEWHVVLDGQVVAVFADEDDVGNEDAAMQLRCAIEARIPKMASRAALVQGIRGLADLLEAHPEIPDPRVWTCVWSHTGGNAAFRGACEALIPLGATVADHPYTAGCVQVKLALGPVTLAIDALKTEVCEPVTEVREVTEHRLPEWAQAPAADGAS